jgi:hypothetical protein
MPLISIYSNIMPMMHIERANMPYQGIECTRSFCMGLTLVEGHSLSALNEQHIVFYKHFSKPIL